MTKLTCTLTVTVTDETLRNWNITAQWAKDESVVPPALPAVRSEIESWLDGLVQDGVLISEYELAIQEGARYTYTCSYCDVSFDSPKELIQHKQDMQEDA